MTYETIDWEVEAKRVARAFGVEGKVEFRQHRRLKGSQRFGVIGVRKLAVPVGEGFFVDVAYETKGRFFALADKTHKNWVSLKIGWVRGDISYGDSGNVEEFSTRLARGLFHLDLLTPEVEHKLTATISAHQKMEWAGEYQQRYRYGL
jgi:hypothetical protein